MSNPIEGVPPPTPQEPSAAKKMPQVHNLPHTNGISGLPVDKAIQEAKQEKGFHVVEPHMALYYLSAWPYEEWIELFCEELANKPDPVQERTWNFFALFGADVNRLTLLVQRREYSALIKELPARELLVQKLMGES